MWSKKPWLSLVTDTTQLIMDTNSRATTAQG
jgi:hypothetical protein